WVSTTAGPAGAGAAAGGRTGARGSAALMRSPLAARVAREDRAEPAEHREDRDHADQTPRGRRLDGDADVLARRRPGRARGERDHVVAGEGARTRMDDRGDVLLLIRRERVHRLRLERDRPPVRRARREADALERRAAGVLQDERQLRVLVDGRPGVQPPVGASERYGAL